MTSERFPKVRFTNAETYRVSTYIADERHIYTGPKHRRKAEALKDLDTIQSALDLRRNLLEAAERALGWIDTGPQSGQAQRNGEQSYHSKLVNDLRKAIAATRRGAREG